MFELTGSVALVAGGASGIGEVIARTLSAAGARVVIADIDAETAARAAQEIGNAALPIGVDITDPGNVQAAVDEVLAAVGAIDILVNNAGLAGRAAPTWEQTDEDWASVMAVNVTGPFYLCRAVLPHMRRRQYGRIDNIASVAGKEGNPNMVAYSASKSADIGLTKSIAKEVAADGICVNAVTPAVIHTKMLEQLTEDQVNYMVERIPMKRTGQPEEVAAVAHFLASKDCCFVTGQTCDASGGRATYQGKTRLATQTTSIIEEKGH